MNRHKRDILARLTVAAVLVVVGVVLLVGCRGHRKAYAQSTVVVGGSVVATAPAYPAAPPAFVDVVAGHRAGLIPDDEAEVLARGPIHEAFAAPIAYEAAAGIVVTVEPPHDVEEVPPDVQPAGDHVVWIPGYWAWDDDLGDFLWVSGLWRVPPAGCQWIPGYWMSVVGGFQWVNGFWRPIGGGPLQYLPPPPRSLEAGPSSPQPGVDFIWTPGLWLWAGNHYVWQPGHWLNARPNRVWVPAYYQWTPRGCVFVQGYWDYPLEVRGVIFAPVRFRPAAYVRPVIRYRPTIVIETRVLTVFLFLRVDTRQYLFGDYFDLRFVDRGIRPWFDRGDRDRWYDPVLAYRRWTDGRRDPQWEKDLRRDYDYRYTHADARPARTHAAEVERHERGTTRGRPAPRVTERLASAAQRQDEPLRLEAVTPDRRREVETRDQSFREHADVRRRDESGDRPAPGRRVEPRREAERPVSPAVTPPPQRHPEPAPVERPAERPREERRPSPVPPRPTEAPPTRQPPQRDTDRRDDQRRSEPSRPAPVQPAPSQPPRNTIPAATSPQAPPPSPPEPRREVRPEPARERTASPAATPPPTREERPARSEGRRRPEPQTEPRRESSRESARPDRSQPAPHPQPARQPQSQPVLRPQPQPSLQPQRQPALQPQPAVQPPRQQTEPAKPEREEKRAEPSRSSREDGRPGPGGDSPRRGGRERPESSSATEK